MTPKEIETLMRCGETSLIQFKREMTSPKQIAAEIVAFANTKGGTVLFGIQDKTGKFWGLDYKQVQEISMSVGNVATDFVKPSIYLTTETVEINGKLVLVVGIPEGKNKPYKDSNGVIWVKQAADKRKLIDNNEILGMFQESQIYQPELAPVQGTSGKDLEVAYLNEYFEKVYGKAKEEFGKPLGQLLKNRGLGSGIVRTLREGVNVDFYNDTHANQFKVVVWKTDDKPTVNGIEYQILDYIKNNGNVTTKDTAKYIGLSITQTKEYLYRLVKADLILSLGANRNKTYRLK